jgi:hypothetical protein
MKYFLTFIFILLAAGSMAAQTRPEAYKWDEFDRNGGGGCDEFYRISGLIGEVDKNPGSKGLIIIYAGDKTSRFGNVMAYVGRAREYFERITKTEPGKFSIVAAAGKGFFNEEFWIVPEGAQPPKTAPVEFDWGGLTERYYFSSSCFQCEPSYYGLSNFQLNLEDYTEILKKYPAYSGLVTVYDRADMMQVIKRLTVENKLPRNRYRVQLLEPDKEYPSLAVELFIIPGRSAISKN